MPVPGFLIDGPTNTKFTVALAHGAGAPMDSPFMNDVATSLAGRGYNVARFEFPYMANRRATGKKGPPDSQHLLIDTWKSVIEHFGPGNVVIGGKSMGGRIASMMASDLEVLGTPVLGLLCFGYPFYPPGKPEKPRIGHLLELETPALILQGERDTLGSREIVSEYDINSSIRIHWLADGDHDFRPRMKSGLKHKDNMSEAVDIAAKFLKTI